ncbi:DUF1206 domain-containing protein [Nocardia salmonicida]|uniref:DUF1206 domain-containing protein n=1 Tax=Nocardia salmonicida TaxID=53431 RepID=UPI0007A4F6C4|nr:DUF1206 domain-containing protein [Nocardia salmonicida]
MSDNKPSSMSTGGSSSASFDNSSSVAGRVAQNSVFERAARASSVVSGMVYLIIGYIAIRIALGGADGSADRSGLWRKWPPSRAASSPSVASSSTVPIMALFALRSIRSRITRNARQTVVVPF